MVFVFGSTTTENFIAMVLLLASFAILMLVLVAVHYYSKTKELEAELDDFNATEAGREEDSWALYEVTSGLSKLRFGGDLPAQTFQALDPEQHGGLFPGIWSYAWRSDTYGIVVEVRYGDNLLSARMTMKVEGKSLWEWKFGPDHDPILELPDAVCQNMGLKRPSQEPAVPSIA